MDKYLAGWQATDKKWLKKRKADWKKIKPVVEQYFPRSKDMFNMLKVFFITGDVERANFAGFTASFLQEDHIDVDDEFDCALYGIDGRVFLLLLFSPIQTVDIYDYVIDRIKKRDDLFEKEMVSARKSYMSCVKRFHYTLNKRTQTSALVPALAGRDELLYQYLHGSTLIEDIEFQATKDKDGYVYGQLNLFGGMLKAFLSMPYPNDFDLYQWNVNYYKSCFHYARKHNITIEDIPIADTALIYYCLFIIENPDDFHTIKFNVAKQYKTFLLNDPLLDAMRLNIDEAVQLWSATATKHKCDELRKLCWESWKETIWLDKTQFDEFGKPLSGEKQ